MSLNQNGSKNQKIMESFVAHCKANPSERFWQALCNWAGAGKILIQPDGDGEPIDTYYLEGK